GRDRRHQREALRRRYRGDLARPVPAHSARDHLSDRAPTRRRRGPHAAGRHRTRCMTTELCDTVAGLRVALLLLVVGCGRIAFDPRTDAGSDDAGDATTAPACSLAGNGYPTCALGIDDRMRCWGDGSEGELGNNATTSSAFPITPVGIDTVRAIGAGESHTCAIRADGTTWCWGQNDTGQVGDGSIGR